MAESSNEVGAGYVAGEARHVAERAVRQAGRKRRAWRGRCGSGCIDGWVDVSVWAQDVSMGVKDVGKRPGEAGAGEGGSRWQR